MEDANTYFLNKYLDAQEHQEKALAQFEQDSVPLIEELEAIVHNVRQSGLVLDTDPIIDEFNNILAELESLAKGATGATYDFTDELHVTTDSLQNTLEDYII